MVGGMEVESYYGTPVTIGGMDISPFDIVGDTLRGTDNV